MKVKRLKEHYNEEVTLFVCAYIQMYMNAQTEMSAAAQGKLVQRHLVATSAHAQILHCTVKIAPRVSYFQISSCHLFSGNGAKKEPSLLIQLPIYC